MTPAPLRAVRENDAGREVTSPGNGNGGRYDRLEERLRVVEGDIREIRTRIENVATKDDIKLAIATMRNWALGGWAATSLVVIGWLIYALVRVLNSTPSAVD